MIKVVPTATMTALLLLTRPATANEFAFQCVNAASGTQWTLKINDARHTVDNFPAKISNSQISWRDTTDNANYQLDRSSGVLTYTNASSTGGYMLFYQCRPK